jgi:hypothetical protein
MINSLRMQQDFQGMNQGEMILQLDIIYSNLKQCRTTASSLETNLLQTATVI